MPYAIQRCHPDYVFPNEGLGVESAQVHSIFLNTDEMHQCIIPLFHLEQVCLRSVTTGMLQQFFFGFLDNVV